jgi:hypothetical protein
MTEAQARAAGLTEEQIAALKLDSGSHSDAKAGHCLLEVVSMFAGEDFGDEPACVDPVLAAFGRSWNDALPDDERQQLKRYILLLPGTAGSDALSQRRGWMAADWLIRSHTPAWLDMSPATAEHAARLRALAPITSEQTLAAAQGALDQARSAADAAMNAARDAARAAARAAAMDAAWDAAMNAAMNAAWAAAGAAAMDAAWDAAMNAAMNAAWDAARAAAMDAAMDAVQKQVGPEQMYSVAYDPVHAFLAPTEKRLQEEAHALYLRMINEKLARIAKLRAA